MPLSQSLAAKAARSSQPRYDLESAIADLHMELAEELLARKIRLRLKLASGAPRWIEGELFELRRMLESCVRRASSRVKAGEVCLTLNVAPGVSGRLELTVSTKLEVEMAESVLVMSGCAVEDPFTASKRDGGELQLLVFHAEEQTGRNIARSLVELGHGVRLARQISAFKRLIDIGKFDVFIFDSSHPNLREFSKIARNFRLPLVSLGRPASPENGALGGGVVYLEGTPTKETLARALSNVGGDPPVELRTPAPHAA